MTVSIFKYAFATCALAVAAISSASAAPILTVSGGKLMGASQIDIGGELYDVMFADGSFNSLYPTGFSSFSIQKNANFASAASHALAAQVFNAGIYTDTPGLTSGCSSNVHDCYIYTPYAPSSYPIQLVAYVLRNSVGTAGDMVDSSWGYSPTTDFSTRGDYTYAVWSVHPAVTQSDIPEPETLMMVGLGLAALGLSRRRSVP